MRQILKKIRRWNALFEQSFGAGSVREKKNGQNRRSLYLSLSARPLSLFLSSWGPCKRNPNRCKSWSFLSFLIGQKVGNRAWRMALMTILRICSASALPLFFPTSRSTSLHAVLSRNFVITKQNPVSVDVISMGDGDVNERCAKNKDCGKNCACPVWHLFLGKVKFCLAPSCQRSKMPLGLEWIVSSPALLWLSWLSCSWD